MAEEDKEKTAFAVPHRGLFEWNVMPFGLINAPAVFQSLASHVLDQLGHFAVAYIDDILIVSPTKEAHLEHINKVFQRLRQYDLKLKLKKCSFFQQETTYLGFVISETGIKPDLDRVKCMREMPSPTSVKECRPVIGKFSYYRRFLPNFSAKAAPIIDLTKKFAKFRWTEEHQKAFDFLKESLSIIPFLGYADPNKPFVLYCDASQGCIGACLTQPCEP